MFQDFSLPKDAIHKPPAAIRWDGYVFNNVSLAMKLTQGKLLKDDDWDVWQKSEYTQLDQHDAQGMFVEPVPVTDKGAVFNSV